MAKDRTGSMTSMSPVPLRVISMFLVILSVSGVSAAGLVGKIAGNFSVNAAGAATYSIPITVPAGANGMAPGIALSYNSQQGVGLAGRGWTLAGLSRIRRCGSTVATDGAPRSIKFDAGDRLCLDGQPLIHVSATEYRKEVHNYERIVQYGAYPGSSASPQYFEVQLPSGRTLIYGNREGGTDATIQAVGTTEVRTWLLKDVIDRYDNRVVYSYYEDPAAGEYHPIRIEWSGNPTQGTSAKYALRFNYENRRTACNGRCPDVWSGYIGGTPWQRAHRLTRITYEYNGSDVHSYSLAYQPGENRVYSLLASVTQCGHLGGTQNCLPPTTFDVAVNSSPGWQNIPGNIFPARGTWAMELLDYDGDGDEEFLAQEPYSGQMYLYMTVNGYLRQYDLGFNIDGAWVTSLDYDGDRDADLLLYTSAGEWRLAKNTGASPPAYNSWTSLGNLGAFPHPIDLNGDGLDDVIYYCAGYTQVCVRMNTLPGAVFSGGYASGLPEISAVAWATYLGQIRRSNTLTDFDGDGREDVLFPVDGPSGSVIWQAHRSTGVQFESTPMGTFTGEVVEILDVNGDGLSDVIYSYNGNWWTVLSTGDGFAAATNTGITSQPLSGPQYGRSPRIVDYEPDGRDDILLPSGTKWRVYTSDGRSFSSARYFETGLPDPGVVSDILPANLRGLGVTDLYIDRNDLFKWTFDFHTGLENTFLLSQINDGLGNTYGMEYGYTNPLTLGQSSTAAHRVTGGAPSGTQNYYNQDMRLVKSYTSNDGVGGSYTKDYRYYDGWVDLSGRGFLGFQKIVVQDSRDVVSSTTYNWIFPYQGRLRQTRTLQAGRLKSIINYAYLSDDTEAAPSDPAEKYYYIDRYIRNIREYDQNGEFRYTTNTPSDFDVDHGVAKTMITAITSPQWAGSFTTQTNRILDNAGLSSSFYCLGMPLEVKVTTTDPATGSAVRMAMQTNNITRCNVATTSVDPQTAANPNPAPMPLVTEASYDGFGNVVNIKTYGADLPAQQRETVLSYDSDGYRIVAEQYLVSETAASCGGSATLNWDTLSHTWNYALGLEAERTAVDGLQTRWTYDDLGRLTRAESLNDTVAVDIAYQNCSGFCPGNSRYQVRLTGSDGRQSRTVHDGYGRQIGAASMLFNGRESRTRTDYDALGRVGRQSIPYLTGSSVYWATYAFDGFNRVISIDRPIDESRGAGAITTLAYNGLQVTETNPELQTITRMRYPTGTLASVADAAGITTYAYTPFGELASITDPGTNVRTFTYNSRGMITLATDPDSGTWAYTYNAYGQILNQTDDSSPNPGEVRFSYDRRGRVIDRRDYAGAAITGLANWSYSLSSPGQGRLTRVSGSNGFTETYTYDTLGLPIRTATRVGAGGVTYVTDRTFDAQRRLDTITYPQTVDGHRPKFKYQYSANGYLSAVSDQTAGINNPIYTVMASDDPLGRTTAAIFGFGRGAYPEQHNYDQANLLLQSIRTGMAGAIQSRTYGWDTLGNLTARQAFDLPGAPRETVVYDRLNRMTQLITTGSFAGSPQVLNLSYDAAGNLLSKSDVGNYNYSGAGGPHAVASISAGPAGSMSFAYDANGNMTNRNGTMIAWTLFNKPRLITAGANSAEFFYGPNRQRIRQVINVTTRIDYVGPHFEVATNGANTTYKSKVFVDGRVVYIQKEEAAGPESRGFYVHRNHQGSVDTLVQAYGSATGEVTQFAFDAFGQRRNLDWGPDTIGARAGDDHFTERGYTGHEHLDGVGVIHMNGRVQEPAIGRMMSPDPVLGSLGNPQSQNPYSYVRNNPLTLADPSGFCPDCGGGEGGEGGGVFGPHGGVGFYILGPINIVRHWLHPTRRLGRNSPVNKAFRAERAALRADCIAAGQTSCAKQVAAGSWPPGVGASPADPAPAPVPEPAPAPLPPGTPPAADAPGTASDVLGSKQAELEGADRASINQSPDTDAISRQDAGAIVFGGVEAGAGIFAGVIGVTGSSGGIREIRKDGVACAFNQVCVQVGFGGFFGITGQAVGGMTAPLENDTFGTFGVFAVGAAGGGAFGTLDVNSSSGTLGGGFTEGIGGAFGVQFCRVDVFGCH